MVNAKPFQASFSMTGAHTATSQYHSSGHIEDRSMVALR